MTESKTEKTKRGKTDKNCPIRNDKSCPDSADKSCGKNADLKDIAKEKKSTEKNSFSAKNTAENKKSNEKDNAEDKKSNEKGNAENKKSNEKNGKLKRFLTLISGMATGFFSGFFGGGGGMVLVPALTGLLKKETKTAHATAIAVILPVTVICAAVYSAAGNYEFAVGFPVTAGTVAGGILGAYLLKKLSADWVKWIFGALMLAAGIKLLFF